MGTLPVGLQDFEEIRTQGYLYVDKTRLIHELVQGSKFWFLARPRRFGKTLLLSTLHALFAGKRALFKGLYIDRHHSFVAHPVIHLSFNDVDFREAGLSAALCGWLDEYAEIYGCQLDSQTPSGKFRELIVRFASGGVGVVVLIDEYDKPITDYLHDKRLAKANRDVLRSFYSVLKARDQDLEFVFMTGVSKFGQTSVFSELNNLQDITVAPAFATICGITQREIKRYLAKPVAALAERRGVSSSVALTQLRRMYNGYSWDGESKVFNPFSLLSALAQGILRNFWFSSGTPKLLIDMLREYPQAVNEIDGITVGDVMLDGISLEYNDAVSLMWQTGYLTISAVKEGLLGGISYVLTYPNQEVRQAFLSYILAFWQQQGHPSTVVDKDVQPFVLLLQDRDIDGLMLHVNGVLSRIPYFLHIDREAYYHSIFYLLAELGMVRATPEPASAQGRPDLVLTLENDLFIVEFKTSTAADAVRQIEEKDYARAYRAEGKQLWFLGFAVDGEKRQLTEWKLVRG